MAYTPKQAKRIRRQYRRIVGPKPKGPKTMEIRGRRGAVQRGDSSFINKAGKVVPLTRRKRLKTMERVIASGKKPRRPKAPVSGGGGIIQMPKSKKRTKLPKMTDAKGRPARSGPNRPLPVPVRRRNRRKTR